jgi:hypothetical protein
MCNTCRQIYFNVTPSTLYNLHNALKLTKWPQSRMVYPREVVAIDVTRATGFGNSGHGTHTRARGTVTQSQNVHQCMVDMGPRQRYTS